MDLPITGNGLTGVHTLRSLKDSAAVAAAADAAERKKVVVIGGSFIGMEVCCLFQGGAHL